MDERRFTKADQHVREISMEDWKYGRLEVNASLTAALIHICQQSTVNCQPSTNYDQRIFHVTSVEGG